MFNTLLFVYQDPVAQLPPDMVSRAYSIFFIMLKYAVEMLTWEQEEQLPGGLEPPYAQTHTNTHRNPLCSYAANL